MKLPGSVDLTCNGECSNCGGCCSNFLPVTKEEIKRLRRFVKKKHIKPVIRSSAAFRDTAVDFICPFRDDKNKICRCYDIRPQVCRMYLCKAAAEGTLPDFKNQGAYSVVNLRKEVFDVPGEITVGDYLVLSRLHGLDK